MRPMAVPTHMEPCAARVDRMTESAVLVEAGPPGEDAWHVGDYNVHIVELWKFRPACYTNGYTEYDVC